MRARHHTPGRLCDECEGFCLQAAARHADAGVDMTFRIGQRVRHRDYKGRRVTGVVCVLSVDSDRGLMVEIVLDEPIVIEAREPGDRPIDIYRQHAPAHEFSAFDERAELVAEMLTALRGVVRVADRATAEFDAARAVIAKADRTTAGANT